MIIYTLFYFFFLLLLVLIPFSMSRCPIRGLRSLHQRLDKQYFSQFKFVLSVSGILLRNMSTRIKVENHLTAEETKPEFWEIRLIHVDIYLDDVRSESRFYNPNNWWCTTYLSELHHARNIQHYPTNYQAKRTSLLLFNGLSHPNKNFR